MIFLVRHAHAGDKHLWADTDSLRPLSAGGRQEAAGLVSRLGGYAVDRIVASPALRCVQTVDQLARQRDMGIEIDQRLRREADLSSTLALLDDAAGDETVLCTHGENIGALFAAFRAAGVSVPDDADYPKGSIWVLDTVGSAVAALEYLPPLRLDHADAAR